MKKYLSKPFALIIAQCFGLMLLVYLASTAVLALHVLTPSRSIFFLLIFFLCYFIRICGIAAIALFLRKRNQTLLEASASRKFCFTSLIHLTALSIVLDLSHFWWSLFQVQVPGIFGFDPYEWPIVAYIFYEEFFAKYLLSGCLLCALLVFAPKLSHKRSVSAS